ncbi:MAG: hypothetical protein MUC28_04420, partial [Planctomycetes bacterium]|nr:hypothetical protein [Planctomycetota bacterium]
MLNGREYPMPKFTNWIKVGVRVPWSPAALTLGREAFAYWIEGTCWASQNESDGHLPSTIFHESNNPPHIITSRYISIN